MALKLLDLLRNLATKKWPETHRLLRLLHCSVFKERTVAELPWERVDRPRRGAKRQVRYGLARPAEPVRHDRYHIAADMACQGMSTRRLPVVGTTVTKKINAPIALLVSA